MDSLVGYGSDDDTEIDRCSRFISVGHGMQNQPGSRRHEDDTNYDDVNMDLSEESQLESEPELPPAESSGARRCPERPERLKRPDRQHRQDLPDRQGRQDHPDRQGRQDLPDRQGRQDLPDRQARQDLSDRQGRQDLSDRQARQDPDRQARQDFSDRQGRQDLPDRSNSDDSRERDRDRDRDRDRERNRDRDRDQDRKERRRESPQRFRDRGERDKERRSPRRDERCTRAERPERSRGSQDGSSRRGLLGDRPDERSNDTKVPALMDLKPFGGEPPPVYGRSQDARDAVSPRFVDRERRHRERDRERHGRRSEERKSSGHRQREHRSRSRGAAYPPPPSHPSGSNERRGSPPSGDYRPSSYKVNKKLEVMEKMGLQIKTPDGSMATAQQLRAAANETPAHNGPGFFNSSSMNTNKIMDQVQKRKLLWANKNKSEAEEAAKWSGTRFAQDSDGKQVSKFMRLMGIKEPAAVKPAPPDESADPNKKQEELFQAMQAQYEVARATTHTMRGVGLGFQRGQF